LKNDTSEGIDIVIDLEYFRKYDSRRFQPNRLEAAKDVAQEFISEGPMTE